MSEDRAAQTVPSAPLPAEIAGRSGERASEAPAEGAGGVRPKLVCLCGSLRFRDEFERQELAHLMRGEIALLPCCMHVDIQRVHGEMSDYKERADARHKQLIDLADEVLVLNVGGYVGDSTAREVLWAKRRGKPIRWLEQLRLCRKCGAVFDPMDENIQLICAPCFVELLMSDEDEGGGARVASGGSAEQCIKRTRPGQMTPADELRDLAGEE